MQQEFSQDKPNQPHIYSQQSQTEHELRNSYIQPEIQYHAQIQSQQQTPYVCYPQQKAEHYQPLQQQQEQQQQSPQVQYQTQVQNEPQSNHSIAYRKPDVTYMEPSKRYQSHPSITLQTGITTSGEPLAQSQAVPQPASFSTNLQKEAISSMKPTAITSKDDVYRRVGSTWGLHIHHSKHIVKEEKFTEGNDELFTETLHILSQLRAEIRSFTEKRRDRQQLIQLAEQYNEMLGQLYQRMDTIRASLQWMYSIEYKDEQENIRNSIVMFHFEFRGLLLTIGYTMGRQLHKLRSWWLIKEYGRREKKLQKVIRKMEVLLSLAHMGTILVAERENVIKKCLESGKIYKRVIYYPFVDTIKVHDYKELADLNVADYFGRIGGQYAPMLRKFLGLMVSITASHSASLEYKPEFRSGIFLASSLPWQEILRIEFT
jgi:hypothetical protein